MIPFAILSQVRIDLRRKLGLGALFALTIFIIICVIARTVTVQKTAVDSGASVDIISVYIWHKVEMDTGMYLPRSFEDIRLIFAVKRSS
jgi:hypothetical protein